MSAQPATLARPDRYGAARARRGVAHFLLGKGASSAAGILVLMLAVRQLEPAAFAAYAALTGFVELVTGLTGLGIAHVLLRFVPDLYGRHLDRSLTAMIGRLATLRLGVAGIALAFAATAAEPLAAAIGLADWAAALRLFLLAVAARIAFHMLFQILEAMLLQGHGQAGFALGSGLRLAGVGLLLAFDRFDLFGLILVEATADAAGALLLFVLLRRSLARAGDGWDIDDGRWLARNRRRVLRFGAAGYLQHLAILFYGSAPNRLLGSRHLAVEAMAPFGVAQALADVVRRYLPAQLLLGTLRPLFFADYARHADLPALTLRAELIFRLNAALLAVPALLLLVAGEALLTLLSAGRYGAEAATLLLLLLVVLVFESRRLLLDVLAQAVERFGLMVHSNLLLSLSTLAAIPLIETCGAIAFPLANLAGLALANELVWRRLAGGRADLRRDWSGLLRLAAAVGLAATAGLALREAGPLAAAAAALAVFATALAALRVFRRDELRALVQFRQG